ncbi:unnamed protein product [Porites lobata]|uniref:Aspartate transaminase n=1 Tax=Porites lobata TaxID=104759 RepID=A0ABN8PZL6_9CNID|nr:unnamed protein product [Porites lobata]
MPSSDLESAKNTLNTWDQFEAKETVINQKIASNRIHVERFINKMFCSGKLYATPMDSGFFLTVVSTTEDLEIFCCCFRGTVQPHGFEIQGRSSAMHFDSSKENLAVTFISA